MCFSKTDKTYRKIVHLIVITWEWVGEHEQLIILSTDQPGTSLRSTCTVDYYVVNTKCNKNSICGYTMDNQTGIKDLQDYVFTNVYQEALRNEQHQISMQVFRMILFNIRPIGKTTFWK